MNRVSRDYKGNDILYRKNRRKAAVAARGGRCANEDCPMPFHPQWGTKAFHFDHIDPRTRKKKGSNYTDITLIIEGKADHIQMLCANCHAVKTHDNHEYNS